MEDCANLGFNFSLTFMTRALTTTVTHRALFETIPFAAEGGTRIRME